ncbi:MAG: NTP transferase domain-containing protein [Planctomycetes bacterium]|nr:NTP transferase domain-containing protein [Planctomycetota bacterium]
MQGVDVTTMILAGGMGERLFPMTCHRAKPAVPFGGNFRILDFTLINCVCSQLRRVHVLTQYHAQSLNRHYTQRWSFLSSELGEYIEMSPPKMRAARGHYQGTADAVYRNLDILDHQRPDAVLILSGDHIYRADYERFIEAHLAAKAEATVLTSAVDAREASSFGVLIADDEGKILRFVEKPADPLPYGRDGICTINLGVYCFSTPFLVRQLVADAKRRTAHDFGKDIFPAALEHGSLHTCALEAITPGGRPYWRDGGTIDSYFQANMDLLGAPPAFELTDPRWLPDSRFHEWVPARGYASARIGRRWVEGRSLISSGVEIEDSTVVSCVLSPRVRVGRGAELEECILFPGAEVGEGARLRRVIVEEGVSIPAGMRVGVGSKVAAGSFTVSPGGVVVVASHDRLGEAPVLAARRRLGARRAQGLVLPDPASPS